MVEVELILFLVQLTLVVAVVAVQIHHLVLEEAE
jgi:hypothetical protein